MISNKAIAVIVSAIFNGGRGAGGYTAISDHSLISTAKKVEGYLEEE